MTIPSWLDPAAEIVNNDQSQAYKDLDAITKSIVFILCMYHYSNNISAYIIKYNVNIFGL